MFERNGIVRHIQFKASHKAAKASRVDINLNLASKPSGCIIWIFFDPETMEFGPFRWFGGDLGEPLPLLGVRVARHSKGNADGVKTERGNSKTLNRGQFEVLPDVHLVVGRYFGVRLPFDFSPVKRSKR